MKDKRLKRPSRANVGEDDREEAQAEWNEWGRKEGTNERMDEQTERGKEGERWERKMEGCKKGVKRKEYRMEGCRNEGIKLRRGSKKEGKDWRT